ncbi:hypothetical protein BRADI_3g44856v3, partial [Brachypodium distachyon]
GLSSWICKGTATLICLPAWSIWKRRNVIIFDNARADLASLIATIKEEARLWALAGVRGLREILLPAAGV